MAALLPTIRNAARAVIVRDRQLLVLKKTSASRGEWHALPGGGQEAGESLVETLKRECVEEIGVSVDVGGLVHVADFYKRRETQPPSTRHLVEFVFKCMVPEDYVPKNGSDPDKHQIDVVWLNFDRLGQSVLYPNFLVDCLCLEGDSKRDCYLGAFQDNVDP